jgi:predicted RNase H-like nuclease (RuvC/YqgF family)
MTWYPGKLNSLLFHGKDGDMFKEFLVSVLVSNCLEQTKVYTDCSSPTVADALPETEPPLAESIKTVSENSVDFNPSSPEYHTCACRSYTANLKDVKLDIAVIQKQIESINRVIDSTNDIIQSMSVILNPSGTESHHISYDLRVETLLREFSSILNEKNRELEQRDNIINSLQEKLIKVENEYQNVESLVAERHEQEQCQHNIEITMGLSIMIAEVFSLIPRRMIPI